MIACVYAELDIAGLLKAEPRSAAELAALTQTDPGKLDRFLSCAGALGFHTTGAEDGKLRLSDLGALLSAESPVSLRAAARLNGAHYRYQPWGHLLEYVKTGSGEGLSPTWENGSLDYLADKPELLKVFEEAMTDLSKAAYRNVNEDQVIADTVNLGDFKRVIDIGSGNGTLLEAILVKNPALHGALFDLENVLEDVEPPPPGHANAGRVEKVPGDYCVKVPPGYDAYVMKNVFHNLPERKCRLLLKNIREAMLNGESAKDKRLFLFEMIVPDAGEQNLIAKLVDLNMSLLLDGTVRTLANYESLLGEAGFDLLRIIELPGIERTAIEAAVRRQL